MSLERKVPEDCQFGNAWAPIRFGSLIPPADRLFTVGIHPQSNLNKRILCEVFGFENVVIGSGLHGISFLDPDTSVLVGGADAEVPGVKEFIDGVGKRNIVLDIRVFARMASNDGYDLSMVRHEGPAANPLHVFQHRMDAEVFPCAPAVTVDNADIFSCGFSGSDRFHLFNRSGDSLILHALLEDEKLLKLFAELPGTIKVWARSFPGKEPAVLVIKTREGGNVIIFDLDTVNRPPEPSGAESLAVHLLLSALGKTRAVFGKFLTAYLNYGEMSDSIEKLHLQYPEFTRLETVGCSVEGREMRVLTVALDFNAPTVLLTSGIHPLEWAPAHGIGRFLMHLLGQCRAGTDYAGIMLGGKKLQWLVCACPDGWETRDLQPPGIDLNRNFPGSWEKCVPGETYWDAYNLRYSTAGDEQLVSRGPSAGSQPETKAMMKLLEGNVIRLADFHETTAFESFFHPPENGGGTVPNLYWHLRVNANMLSQFNGRFYANGNIVAFRPGLNEFSTYRFREQRHLDRIVPGPHCGWIMYAAGKGIPAMVLEAAGADCTHYQTIRRTEYAATAAEQILGHEGGAFMRNTHAVHKECTVSVNGMKGPFEVRICDGNGMLSEKKKVSAESNLIERLQPDCTMFIRHFQY